MREYKSNIYDPKNNNNWKIHKTERKIIRNIQEALVTEYIPKKAKNINTSWRILRVVWCTGKDHWGFSCIQWHGAPPQNDAEMCCILDAYMAGIQIEQKNTITLNTYEEQLIKQFNTIVEKSVEEKVTERIEDMLSNV